MYDPFARGPRPVGVRSLELADAPGRSPLAVEVWYPAAPAFAGRDLDAAHRDRFEVAPGLPATTQDAVRDAEPAEGPLPLVVFSHGALSHRRAGTQLCTQLASHGYAVASADHAGSTLGDLLADLAQGGAGERRVDMPLSQASRPREVSFLIDRLLAGDCAALRGRLAPGPVGVCGISFGGWTALAVSAADPRVGASLPIVPAYGKGPLATEQLPLELDGWGRDVPTLILAAERDALIALAELRRLHAELRCTRRLVVLLNAGHVHFTDGAAARHELLRMQFKSGQMPPAPGVDFVALGESMRPFSEHCSAETGADTLRALGTAHMDAWLRGSSDARAFLGEDLANAFAARGIGIEAA